MSDIDAGFENWLHGNAPSEGIYEGGDDRHTWTDERIRELMQMSFEAGWNAGVDWWRE